MPDMNDGQTQTYAITSGNSLFAWSLVKVVAGALTLCGAGDTPDGHVSRFYDGNATYAPLVRRPFTGIPLGKADAAITAYAPVYAGASGTISMTATGPCLGIALEAATAAGDEIKYLPRTNGHESFRIVAAGTAYTDATAETALGSVTIPAGRLRAGTRVRFRAQGTNTSGNSSNTLNIKTYLGGLSGINLAATGTFDVTDGGGDIFYVEGEIVVRTSGASGTFVACGVQALGVPATVTAKPWFKASSAVNTTIANDLTISGTWSAQSASNSCRLDILSVDIID